MSKRKNVRGRIAKAEKRLKKMRIVPEFVGTAMMSREGFVFVRIEGQEEDVFVKASKTRGALHGDTVRVAVTQEREGNVRRRSGEIIAIVERSKKPFVGILHIVGKQAWVLMSSKTMPYDISVPVPEGGVRGMKVAAVVDEWPRGEAGPIGHVVDILGMPGENDTEMHAILAEFGLPYKFEKAVENAADQISEEITDKDRAGRKDFRKTLTFTIDPADAKGRRPVLPQAGQRQLRGGRPYCRCHLLREARNAGGCRGPGPRHLRLPGGPHRTHAPGKALQQALLPAPPRGEAHFLRRVRDHPARHTPLAKVINPWFGRTEIISDYRFSYELAQEIIDAGDEAMKQEFGAGSECGIVPDEVKEAVLKLNKLALILRKRRFAAGAVNFDRPEMKVDIDENGKPIGVHQKFSKEANWLIEEFMLLANKNVAEFVASGGKMGGKALSNAKTFVYRVHDEPNLEKVTGLREFAGNLGYKMGPIGSGKDIALSLNNLLSDAKEKPELGAIQILALRAMAKACYSTDNIGHYGLAFKFYTHFTSPIRRYPDLMVHRLLAMYLRGADSQSMDYYTAQCKHASEREVVAAEAERESVKYKLVEFMEDKVGQEFDGHVSGVTQWGIYVEIEPTKIEGMIPYRTIRSDFYDFDEDHYRAVGRRNHGVIKLGDPLRIRVKGTNLEQKLLDYELVEPEMENAPELSESDYLESLTEAPMPNRPRKPAKAARTPRKGALKAERERLKKGRK